MVYANYAALAAVEVEGVDYLRTVSTVPGATYSSIAIHGGGIEAGSGEMAQYVAGTTMSYYEFDGIKSTGNSALHITSTLFDEPLGLALVAAAPRCLSFHGFTGTVGVPETAVGGGDAVRARMVAAALETAGFTVITAPSEIDGADPDNICNRSGSGGGVQLEMSLALRQSFFPGGSTSKATRDSGVREPAFYAYAAAVLSALGDFPDGPTPLLAEMLIDGVWTDVTSDIRGNSETIQISRGRRDIQGRIPPTTADFMLNNGGEDPADRGKYTDDNPLSPYFGLLPIYTQFRCSMPTSADGYFYTPGFDAANYFITADKAQLDITGDIDIMAEINPSSFFVPVERDGLSDRDRALIVTKTGNITGQFSWAVSLSTQGQIGFTWAPTGISGAGTISESSSISMTDRIAVRVTMDVNNGLGGHTISTYTAPSIDGTWTLLSSLVNTTSGGTSIFSGSGNVEVGAGWGGDNLFTDWHTWAGKVYAVRVYSGIFGSGGTLVADADFRSQGPGVEVFADGVGNTWTKIGDGGVITSDSVRYWGEIESFPQEWDETGKDMWCRIHAADLIQRLQTSQTPLNSPLYDNRTALDTKGYWPFEDGSTSTWAAAASSGTKPAQVKFVRFKAADDLPGSDGAIQFVNGGAFIRGEPRITSITGTASMFWCFKMGTVPGVTVQIISGQVTGSSTVKWWRVETDGTSFTIRAFAPDGTSLLSTATFIGGVDLTQWLSMRLELTTSGGNIAWALAWLQVGVGNNFLGNSGTIAGSVGRFVGFTVNGSSNNTDMYLAHVAIDTKLTDFVNTAFRDAFNAYDGEKFGTRFKRLCDQEGIIPELDGWYYDTEPCGPQKIDTVLNNLYDGSAVDGGFLVGSRRRGNALTYVTRRRTQVSPYAVSLQHDTGSELARPPKPVRDTVGVANTVTVSRPGGSSAVRQITDGRLGTDAIGIVPGGGSFNVSTDAQTEALAGWLAAVGTDPNARFPEITVALHRTQTLMGSAQAQRILVADVGRWVELTNMPAGQKPGPVEQVVQGYSEVHGNRTWTITFNGTPYAPWRGYLANFLIARAVATSTTCGAANSSATSLTFTTAAGSARWVTAADLPSGVFTAFDIVIAGEVMSLTNVTGTTNVQTATVIRSVNGVVKDIPAGSVVQLNRVAQVSR